MQVGIHAPRCTARTNDSYTHKYYTGIRYVNNCYVNYSYLQQLTSGG